MALTTLSALKTHLGITGTSEDAYLTQLLAGVEPAVLRYLNRSIEQATATEYLNPAGRQKLVLPRRPVTAVSAVFVDATGYGGQNPDAFAADTELAAGEDYWVNNLEANEGNPSLLVRVNARWPDEAGSVKVTYTAGYATVPADIAMAVHILVGVLRSQGDKGAAIQSETIGSYSYSLMAGAAGASSADMVQVQNLLAPYREVIL